MVYLLRITATENELCLFLDYVAESYDCVFPSTHLSYTAEFSAIQWYVSFSFLTES